MLGPLARKEFLGRDWAVGGGLEAIVDQGGLVIEFTQGAKSEDEIHATNKTWIVLNVFHVVECIEPAFEIGAEKHGTVDVEMSKVNIDDFIDHFPVFRQPNGEFWG